MPVVSTVPIRPDHISPARIEKPKVLLMFLKAHFWRVCDIVIKSLANMLFANTSDLYLRLLTNELGGRLDYGQPCCLHHTRCRCIGKALISFLSLHTCNSVSSHRCARLVAAFHISMQSVTTDLTAKRLLVWRFAGLDSGTHCTPVKSRHS